MNTININSCYYNEIYNSEHRKNADINVLYGGASSGKSYYMLGQHIPLSFLKKEKRNWLVLRKVNRTVKKSVYSEFKKGLYSLGLENNFKENKSEQTFTHKSGYQVIFSGLDDREKIKSITPKKGILTDIVMEEATDFYKDDFKQLLKRLRGPFEEKKQLWLLFNPIYKTHWIYTTFFSEWENKRYEDNSYHIQKYKVDNLETLIMRTTHYDNKFLAEEDHYRLENETDDYFKKVYTYGDFGVIGNLIFTNWIKDDLSDITPDMYYHGLDFGFHPDPCAYVKSGINLKKKEIYIFDEAYVQNATSDIIYYLIKDKVKNDLLICDKELRTIKELKQLGIQAIPAEKGKGSIKEGIRFLQKFKIFIDKNKCPNLIREFSLYQNKKDKYGEPLPEPEDKNNHGIDALRYSFERIQKNLPLWEV